MAERGTSSRTVPRRRWTQAAQGFFKTFDDDEQAPTRRSRARCAQGLFLMNSRVVNAMLQTRACRSAGDRPHVPDETSRVRQLFLRTLSREPSAAESARFVSS